MLNVHKNESQTRDFHVASILALQHKRFYEKTDACIIFHKWICFGDNEVNLELHFMSNVITVDFNNSIEFQYAV